MLDMNPQQIKLLKDAIRSLATEAKIDLRSPENKYTLWIENGPQGFSFFGGSASPAEVYQLLADRHTTENRAVVFERSGPEDSITLITFVNG